MQAPHQVRAIIFAFELWSQTVTLTHGCVAKHSSALYALPLSSCSPTFHTSPYRPLPFRLDLSGCPSLGDACLAALASLPSLACVNLCGAKSLTGVGLAALAHATSLTEINLAHSSVSDVNALAALPRLKQLVSFRRSCWWRDDDDWLTALAQFASAGFRKLLVAPVATIFFARPSHCLLLQNLFGCSQLSGRVPPAFQQGSPNLATPLLASL